MKSTRYLITLLIVLVIVALILVLKNQKSTIPAGLKNVAVTNTHEIDKIVIWSGTDKVILEKPDQVWRLNNSFEVKKTAIDLVLNMLQRLEIAAPLPRNYQNIAAKKLENTGKHVQLYKGDQIIRSFFIDYDTTEIRGTIYMKEGSKTPFFLKLKGYSLSDISLLFSPRIRFWRNNILFRYQPTEISGIRIEYPGNKSQSFEIDTRVKNQPELIKIHTGEKMQDFDYKSILDYMYYFSGFEYHSIETDSMPETDNRLHFADIRITDGSNTTVQVKLYRKARGTNSKNTRDFDLYWCYGKINDEEEIIAIKYVDIDPILRELDDFLKK